MSGPLSKEAGVSDTVRTDVESRLAQLRDDCAVKRALLKGAYGPRWSGQPRENPDQPSSWDLHWEKRQEEAKTRWTKAVETADKVLVDFISQHRALMGPEWIGNDHGRLCWAPYLGGSPIDQHYCQREEGHDENHADEWPEHRWACNEPRGSWPREVTCDSEWQDLKDNLKNGETGLTSDEQ